MERISGNQNGNHKRAIRRRAVAHYGASSEEGQGFSGEASELIMPGSRLDSSVLVADACAPVGSTARLYFSD